MRLHPLTHTEFYLGTKSVSNSSFKFGENSSGLFKFGVPTAKEADVAKNPTSEIATQTSQSVTVSKPTGNFYSHR